MKQRLLVVLLTLGVLIGLAVVSFTPASTVAQSGRATVDWLVTPTTDKTPFKQALGPTQLKFPQDFGPHEDYQTEWWYYTGNLETSSGRPFGYELTLFRRGLTPGISQNPVQYNQLQKNQLQKNQLQKNSQWRSNQAYFAHFTISDIEQQHFYPAERFSRGAAGLAGAQASPYRVWLDNWSIQELKSGQVQLQAQTQDVFLDLTLDQNLPPIMEGDRGYSVKGPEPGNASYYYSIVQQPTRGILTLQGEPFEVTGVSWNDHEYSTSALSQRTEGWDWFSCQFDDQSALMLYRLRQTDGGFSPQSSGTFIAADGKISHLNHNDFTLETLETWTSPQSGTKYPAQWRITLPTLAQTLTVKPLMANQELNLSTTYWEGAVQIEGQRANQPMQGQGYVELTGYNHKLNF